MGSRVLSLSSWDTVQTSVAPCPRDTCEAVEWAFRARALGTRWTWFVPWFIIYQLCAIGQVT